MSADDTTFHGDPYPPSCCPACDSRRQEAVELRVRASLLRDAIRRSDPRIVVEWHAVELLGMLAARGMA